MPYRLAIDFGDFGQGFGEFLLSFSRINTKKLQLFSLAHTLLAQTSFGILLGGTKSKFVHGKAISVDSENCIVAHLL